MSLIASRALTLALSSLVLSIIPLAAMGEPPLEPIEQGTTDANPLAAPARVQPLDLRLPLGFDRIYRVVEPGRSSMNQRYARSSGAITAVFPRSQYTPTRDGVIPEIPAGTVFYIGGLPDDIFSSPPPAIRRGPTYVDRAVRATPDFAKPVDSRIAPNVPRSADRTLPREPRERPSPACIMSDEGFRQARIAELIDRAAASRDVPRAGGPR
jgi:hypothetical protein